MEPQEPTHVQTQNPTQDEEMDQRQKEALAAFSATLRSVGTNLEAPLRERATIINSNAGSLEKQEAELAAQSSKLAKQNESWEKINDETRDGLKEIGDVQNWAEMIERDLLVLESMMDDVEGDEMSVDGSVRSEHEHDHDHDHALQNGNGNGNGEVEMNGNGYGNDVRKDKDKKKRKSWFSWW